MLNNLTAPFLAAMSNPERVPIQFLVIHFTSGKVYLSDRNITIGDILYEGLVESWGTSRTVGAENAISSTMEMSITIWNGGQIPFSNYFLGDDPINTLVDVYQTFEGLTEEDAAHIGNFVIQDQLYFTEKDQLIRLDLVTTNMKYFGQVGSLLTKELYSRALEADMNKSIDLIIGDAGHVQTLCSVKPPVATLSGSFLESAGVVIYTHENLNDLGFPWSGYIQIDDEIMGYNTRQDNSMQIISRGYLTTNISDHSDGSEIIQYGINLEYIIGQGPVSSISDVRAEGQLVPEGSYTPYLNTDPAKIVFPFQPVFDSYSKGTQRFDEAFDGAGTTDPYRNTASQPSMAYSPDHATNGAIIEVGQSLNLVQTTSLIDKGQIVKVFLRVDHWPTNLYEFNRARVCITDPQDVNASSYTVIGYLSRPNPDDAAFVEGKVDLYHGHDHSEGGDHGHGGVDGLDVTVTEPGHPHGLTNVGTAKKLLGTPYDKQLTVTTTPSSGGQVTGTPTGQISITRASIPYKTASESITVTYRKTGTNDGADGRINTVWVQPQRYYSGAWRNHGQSITITDPGEGGTIEIPIDYQIDTNVTPDDRAIKVTASITTFFVSSNTLECNCTFSNLIWEFQELQDTSDTANAGVGSTQTPGSVPITAPEVGTNKPIKAIDDVDDLPPNTLAEIQDIITQNSGRTVTERFDVTKILGKIDWPWIQNRKAFILFHNEGAAAEDVEIVVTNMNFEVEFRQREVKTTDNITCSVKNFTVSIGGVGISSPQTQIRPDQVVQYLLTEKAGVPANMLSSVFRDVPKWDDSEIWDDNEIWSDAGEVEEAPDGALFEEAAAWYAGNTHYGINGVIPGNISVKDACQKVTWQSRSKLLWQHGTVQLVIKRKTSEWTIAKTLGLSEVQLKSFNSKRSPVADIINKIDVFHTIDRLSTAAGSGKYDLTAFVSDSSSIERHGLRVQDDLWLFDLVRNQAMADDLADYYLWLLSETTIYYGFSAYLNNYNLEKGDYIKINAYKFAAIQDLPVVITEIQRIFGSGKNNSINILNMITQSIKQKSYIAFPKDIFSILDALNIESDYDLDLSEVVQFLDELRVSDQFSPTESISFIDALVAAANYFIAPTEIITLSDGAPAIAMDKTLSDEFTITDILSVNLESCFGACGFGGPADETGACRLPFGARTIFALNLGDTMTFLDTLVVGSFSSFNDAFSIDDDGLALSDGFGGVKLSDGFGHSPFGY